MKSEKTVRTKDGYLIQVTTFAPKKPNKSVLVIGPSAGVNQGYYSTFANFMAQHNFTVITFDYRDIGNSLVKPIKESKTTLKDWGLFDLDSVLLTAKNQYPAYELIYLGHQISAELVALAPAFQFINRIVFFNSGLSFWRTWSFRNRIIFLFLAPVYRIINTWYGFFPGKLLGFQHDLPQGVMQSWLATTKYKTGVLQLAQTKGHHYFTGPLLSYNILHDPLVSATSVNALLKYFPKAQQEAYFISPDEMSLDVKRPAAFFREQEAKALWTSLVRWLDDPGLA